MTQGNISPIQAAPNPIDPGVRIGHVHLRTADIDRVRDFYVGVLGFDVVAEARAVPGWGTTGDILFVSAGGYHHHLGFNTWKSAGGGPQPDGVTGLHHVALNYPTRAGLADAVRRLQRASVPLRQLSDHGTHEAVYLSDPDGNDLELAWDRPMDQRPQLEGGGLAPIFDDLDLEDLLSEPEPSAAGSAGAGRSRHGAVASLHRDVDESHRQDDRGPETEPEQAEMDVEQELEHDETGGDAGQDEASLGSAAGDRRKPGLG
jgi:catechol 2,3-dioxygenase